MSCTFQFVVETCMECPAFQTDDWSDYCMFDSGVKFDRKISSDFDPNNGVHPDCRLRTENCLMFLKAGV